MKKIINKPEKFVEEVMEGIFLAFGDNVKTLDGDNRILISNYPASDGKVGIVTAGGSGHLPLFLGYVGQGMLDGCTIGNVFASPSAQKMSNMIRACNRGNGVLCLFGNYGGDSMNFEMACEMVEFEDNIETRIVKAKDDVASATATDADNRRGVAGIVYAYKIAGAAADEMKNLDEVADIAQKTLDNTRSMGVALSPCIIPEIGKPTFTINEEEIEIGMGIHGEAGIKVCKMMTADEIADVMLTKIALDMPLTRGDEVSIMVNGLGATPLEEQFILFRSIHHLLAKKGISIYMPHIGEFATSMEMSGVSVSVLKLDDKLKELLNAPAKTPFYTNLNRYKEG